MIELTSLEKHLFQRARELDVNPFSSHFFKLPASGTRYTPEDHVRQYEMLYNLWLQAGSPGDKMALQADGQDLRYLVEWGAYGSEPVFLFPHGYLFLPWAIDMIQSGKRIAVVEGGTGSAKCLPAGTLIQMMDGSRRPIENVKAGDQVYGLDNAYYLSPQSVTGCFRDLDDRLLEIALRQGQKLTCSLSHPLRTVNGWKEARDLSVGDYVAVPRRLPFGTRQDVSPDEAILLGLLLGDGCLCRKRGSPYFTNSDPNMRRLFRRSCDVLFPGREVKFCHSKNRTETLKLKKLPTERTNPLRDWRIKFGIDGKGSHDKFVPEIIFSQNSRIVALFLNALYGRDGYASTQSGHPLVSYTSVSRRLVEDVQSLLLHFGIISMISRRVSNYKNKVYYTLIIGESAHVRTFCQFIDIACKEESTYEVYRMAEGRDGPGNLDIIPRSEIRGYVKRRAKERGTPLCKRLPDGSRPNENMRMRKNVTRKKLLEYASWLEDPWLYDLATSDVYWTEIQSITPAGKRSTYNLEVSPDSNFIADGVITHNTSALGIYSIIQCALYPGCDILNVAPSADQARDMLIEINKWVEHSEFAKFVTLTNNGDLYKQEATSHSDHQCIRYPEHVHDHDGWPRWELCVGQGQGRCQDRRGVDDQQDRRRNSQTDLSYQGCTSERYSSWRASLHCIHHQST